VVGKKKFAFDIWGDTVNTAARMEQNGIGGEINVSGVTFNAVSHVFTGESRGEQEVKGKGKVEMFLIKGYLPQYRESGKPHLPGAAFDRLISAS
jgi:class 3 adenylate cyclase